MNDMRAVNWSFKKCENNLSAMKAPCMDPVFIGIKEDSAIRREVAILKDAGFNTLMIEGLRRLMLYEHEGKSAEVRAAVARATRIAHEAGLRVFYHSTCTFVAPTLDGLSPSELSMLSINGETGKHAYIDGWNGWYLWCLNNPDFKREYYRLAKQMVEETHVDGMMTDEVYFRTGWRDCVCPHCLAKFKGPIPEVDFENPDWLAWIRFRLQSVGDFYEGLRAVIGGIPLMGCKNNEPNPQHSQAYGENNDERMRGTSILFTEICDRELKQNWQRAAANCAAYQALGNHWKVPVAILGISDTPDIEFTYGLRMAYGGRPWVGGSALMKRSLSPEDNLSDVPGDVAEWKRIFQWEDRYLDLLVNSTRPAATVALLLSASTRDQYSHEKTDFVKEFHGWCEALTKAHIQFAVITEYELTPAMLDPYQVLIIPQAVCLPDIDLEAYTGEIIVTGESGTRDAHGKRRTRPLFKHSQPLNTFDVAQILPFPTPLRVISAPPSLLVKGVWSADGMLIHIVNCGEPVCKPLILEIENVTEAEIFSPDFSDKVSLKVISNRLVVPPELIKIYSVIRVSAVRREGCSGRLCVPKA